MSSDSLGIASKEGFELFVGGDQEGTGNTRVLFEKQRPCFRRGGKRRGDSIHEN